VCGERLLVVAEAGGALLSLLLGLLGDAPQGLLDRGAGRGATEGTFCPGEDLLVDLDGRALDHMYILHEKPCTY
jgi:hypothetical protein